MQEILLHARPRGLIQWQFTCDYGLLRASGKGRAPEPTARFWVMKHFCNLTPLKAEALLTASDRDDVLLTAFRGVEDGKPALVLHLANVGPGRLATVEGIPPGIEGFRAIRTSRSESYKDLTPVTVMEGRVSLELPAQSLTTLVANQD